MERQPVTLNLGLFNSGLLLLALSSGWLAYLRSGNGVIAMFCGFGAALAFGLVTGALRIAQNKRRLSELGVAVDAERLEDAPYFAGRGLIAGSGAYLFVQVTDDAVYVQIGHSARGIPWDDIDHLELQGISSSTFASISGTFRHPAGELLLPWTERFNRHVPARFQVDRGEPVRIPSQAGH